MLSWATELLREDDEKSLLGVKSLEGVKLLTEEYSLVLSLAREFSLKESKEVSLVFPLYMSLLMDLVSREYPPSVDLLLQEVRLDLMLSRTEEN